MIAAAITEGEVLIENCIPQHLEPIILKLQEAQVDVEVEDSSILVRGGRPVCKRSMPERILIQGFPLTYRLSSWR